MERTITSLWVELIMLTVLLLIALWVIKRRTCQTQKRTGSDRLGALNFVRLAAHFRSASAAALRCAVLSVVLCSLVRRSGAPC